MKRRFETMEMTLSNGFCEMNEKEIMCVDGGGAVAAVYALGFVFGCSPMGALCICGGVAVASGAAG